MRARATVAGLLGAGIVSGAAVTGAASPAAADVGVCTGVAGCHVVSTADVNGDGRADTVAIARRGADGAPSGSVIVRVKTSATHVASTTRRTSYWYGGLWQGAAPINSRPGKEIVVGYTSGAHTLFYSTLTWRNGNLVTLNQPGGARRWAVDGTYNINLGWKHRSGDPVGVIRRRVAERKANGRFRGTVTKFRWGSDGVWHRVGSTVTDPLSDSTAFSWGGWQFTGLQRF
jgi:hypothetical protein